MVFFSIEYLLISINDILLCVMTEVSFIYVIHVNESCHLNDQIFLVID